MKKSFNLSTFLHFNKTYLTKGAVQKPDYKTFIFKLLRVLRLSIRHEFMKIQQYITN